MRAQRLLFSIGIACLWSLAGDANAQQGPATFPFGSVSLTVPPPEDHVEVFATNPQLRQYFVGPIKAMADVLAGYVPTKAFPALQQTGRLQNLETFALLGTSPELRNLNVTPEYFQAMANKVRAGLGGALQRNEAQIAAAVADVGKRMKSDSSWQGSGAIGVFDDRSNRIGILLVNMYSFDGSPTPILSASTLVRVHERLLFAYVYSRDFDPKKATGLTSLARSWTDAIWAANGDGSAQRR
jgi:hypothetical protein